MPSKPAVIPRIGVNTSGTLTSTAEEPGSDLKDNGFDAGDRFPAQIADWVFGTLGQWVQWLDSLETQAITWTARHTFQDGVLISAPTTNNRIGLDSTGKGTGAGLKGTGGNSSGTGVVGIGGSSNGNGVDGTGTGSGIGVIGRGSMGAAVLGIQTGSGAGIQGDASGGSGYGGELIGNGTSAPLRLAPQTQPSGVAKGQFFYDSASDTVKFYNGTTWRTFTST